MSNEGFQTIEFENYVNYAGSKTVCIQFNWLQLFENYVNYAGSKTEFCDVPFAKSFENYVNYAGSKTDLICESNNSGLRTM